MPSVLTRQFPYITYPLSKSLRTFENWAEESPDQEASREGSGQTCAGIPTLTEVKAGRCPNRSVLRINLEVNQYQLPKSPSPDGFEVQRSTFYQT